MKLKFKWKFLKKFFRREDPMKLKNVYLLKMFFYILFFGEKNNKIIFIKKNFYKKILLELWNSSSRDNSIIFIKDLIELNVCDLDVELNFYICAEAYIN